MKDKLGVYYYPNPQNKRVHMYVKEEGGMIWFRLWHVDDPKLWDDHGWMPYDAIKQAEGMYNGRHFNPGLAYNLDIAKALIEESK